VTAYEMTETSVAPRAPWSPFAGVIYGVRLVDSPEFRYVGLTTHTIVRRRSEHWKTAERGMKTPFADWLRAHADREAVYFQSLELVMSDDLDDLGEAEQRWIARLRADGHRLLNLTDGGLGPRGYVWTEEQRRAVGDRTRGTKHPNPLLGPDNPMWGRTHSDEQKAAWSEQRRGTNVGAANPNFGKFGADHPAFGRATSDETRARLSEQKRGDRNPNFAKTVSDETRAKMSAAQKGRPKPSSVRSAHTRHHTNKARFSATCRHCVDEAGKTDTEETGNA
jgi:hypothetical protein